MLCKLVTRIKNKQLVKILRENTSRFCGEIFGLQSGKICMGASTLNFCFTLRKKKKEEKLVISL